MSDKRKIDPELFNTFVDDTLEEISVVENQLIKLEKSPEDHELINSILRPIHSAKGNCSFFGLSDGKKLAHTTEDVLNCALNNKNVITPELTNIFIKCIDLIQKILKNVRDGGDELDGITEKYNTTLRELEEHRDQALDQSFKPAAILEKLNSIQSEIKGLSGKHAQDLTDVISIISKLDHEEASGSSPRQIVSAAMQDIRNIFTGSMECALNQEKSDNVGELLNTISTNCENTPAEEYIKEALEQYKNITSSLGFEPFLAEIIEEQFVKLDEVIGQIPDKSEETDSEINPEDSYDFTSTDRFELTQDEINALLVKRYKSEAKEEEEEHENLESSRTMRVSEHSVDHFLESVGKLIVVREMYNNFNKKIATCKDTHELQKQLKRINETFYQLSERLNDSVMEIRKISVSSLMQKVPRIVRDVANTKGKKIQVQLVGEDTLIDKRLIEILDAPMIHIIRNAADHGIESPETRIDCGKPEEGRITVEFSLKSDNVILTISDDGGGLDFNSIMEKAISMDLLDPGIELTPKEKESLIFLPGLTTSSTVTEISGRGVGMDVVKRNIEDAGGKISIETSPGHGTVFTIKLPQAVMTQIITGYVVRIDNNQYILPMENIHEVFRLPESKINCVTGKGMCVKRRNQLMSVIRPFSPYEYTYSADDMVCLVTFDTGKQLVALHIDDAVGVQRVVLNKVKGLNVQSDIFTASAIMGDGAIAMVIEPKAIWQSKVN